MSDDRTQCPIPGCPERIERAKLMCRMHWRMVPRLLQADVNDAYRRWERLVEARNLDQMMPAVQALRMAQSAAIAAVRPETEGVA